MIQIKLKSIMFLSIVFMAILSEAYAQNIKNYIGNNVPNTRYTLNGDGTLTDMQTGLMWMRCTLGSSWDGANVNCIGTGWGFGPRAAITHADESIYATHDDWRLPNITELRSLVGYDRFSPSINVKMFPNSQSSKHWTSSPSEKPNRSWVVDFWDGSDYEQDWNYSAKVRLVRNISEPNDEQPSTINIIGTWDYTVSYTSCPDDTENGTMAWTYQNGYYQLTLHREYMLDHESCEFAGNIIGTGNESPASNPITVSEFVAGAFNIDYFPIWEWDTIVFDTTNKIVLTGKSDNSINATPLTLTISRQ